VDSGDSGDSILRRSAANTAESKVIAVSNPHSAHGPGVPRRGRYLFRCLSLGIALRAERVARAHGARDSVTWGAFISEDSLYQRRCEELTFRRNAL